MQVHCDEGIVNFWEDGDGLYEPKGITLIAHLPPSSNSYSWHDCSTTFYSLLNLTKSH